MDCLDITGADGRFGVVVFIEHLRAAGNASTESLQFDAKIKQPVDQARTAWLAYFAGIAGSIGPLLCGNSTCAMAARCCARSLMTMPT